MVGLIITLPGSISASALNKVRHVLLCCRKLWRERWGDEEVVGVRRVGRYREEWKDCSTSVGRASSKREQPEGPFFFEHIYLLWWVAITDHLVVTIHAVLHPYDTMAKYINAINRTFLDFVGYKTHRSQVSLHLIFRFVTVIFCLYLDIYRSVGNVGYSSSTHLDWKEYRNKLALN
jgi:hypothetical protein